VPFLSSGLCLVLRRQIYGGHGADPGGRFLAAKESCARVALAAVAAISRARSAASPQVSHTATYAHPRGMTVPGIVTRVSRAAKPAPAMLPPMARRVIGLGSHSVQRGLAGAAAV